jgi:cell wall-associated NlpC family hydrolase
MTPQALIRSAADAAAEVVQPVYLDARFPVIKTEAGWVMIRLPRGTTGWLPDKQVRLAQDPDLPVSQDEMWALAEVLTGSPYLWGGTTPAAFDCSGFIFRLYHAFGVDLPRDADDQAVVGLPVQAFERKLGDLIFTSEIVGGPVTHVVMVWDEGRVIDASYPDGLTIRPLSVLLEANRWVGARRINP